MRIRHKGKSSPGASPAPGFLSENIKIGVVFATGSPESPGAAMARRMSIQPKIEVVIDGCVWNRLFDDGIDLFAELPPTEFRCVTTPEMELELRSLETGNPDLWEFIQESRGNFQPLKEDRLFGFEQEGVPKDERRYGGLGPRGGRWAEPKELEIARCHPFSTSKKRPTTPLYKNEADAALAMRSRSFVILTADENKGPLKNGKADNGSPNPPLGGLSQEWQDAWRVHKSGDGGLKPFGSLSRTLPSIPRIVVMLCEAARQQTGLEPAYE